uniref:LysR family transcriptional regulator n=1 Tax=Methylobacterium sp. B34 TaxID=95563 RepID=UPI0003471C58|nr:LysR family transcriptional regulator [Methylobacterium sp. B34]
MNWRSVDLNLFFVFDAIAEERSITAAAQRLNLSQSAVSHALARLRRVLGDDLFVRSADGMEPTPYASELVEPIHRILALLRNVLVQSPDFDPTRADTVFRIAVDNSSALVLAPRLSALATVQAPGVTLDLRPSGTLDILDRLERGDIDLAIGNISNPGGGRLNVEPLFDDTFVILARQAHPGGVGGIMTLDALAIHSHLSLTSTGEDDRFLDAELSRHQLTRHVATRAPLLSAPAILTRSDMVAVVSERLARAFVAERSGLEILRLAFVPPRTTTAMLWHRRADDTAAQLWLRQIVRICAKDVGQSIQ